MVHLLGQKIIIVLILVSFLASALFGLFIIHQPDGQMMGDCPFSLTDKIFCPQDLMASISHHLNTYRAFLNITVNHVTAALILLLSLPILFLVSFQPHLFLFSPFRFKISFCKSLFTSQRRKIIRWLSLFENSPTLLLGA